MHGDSGCGNEATMAYNEFVGTMKFIFAIVLKLRCVYGVLSSGYRGGAL